MTPWTVARQSPLSMGFSRQEYWSGLQFSSLEDFPSPEIKPWSPALEADSLPLSQQGRVIFFFFLEVIKIKWSHRMGRWSVRISVLLYSHSLCKHTEERQREGDICKPGREPSPKSELADPQSDPNFQNWEKINFCCLSLPPLVLCCDNLSWVIHFALFFYILLVSYRNLRHPFL